MTDYEKQKIIDMVKGMSDEELLVVINAINERLNSNDGAGR